MNDPVPDNIVPPGGIQIVNKESFVIHIQEKKKIEQKENDNKIYPISESQPQPSQEIKTDSIFILWLKNEIFVSQLCLLCWALCCGLTIFGSFVFYLVSLCLWESVRFVTSWIIVIATGFAPSPIYNFMSNFFYKREFKIHQINMLSFILLWSLLSSSFVYDKLLLRSSIYRKRDGIKQ